jgi:hypothetical protein
MGAVTNAYNILAGNPEEKTSLGRPRYRWEDDIKIDLTKIVLEGVNWIHLAQNGDLIMKCSQSSCHLPSRQNTVPSSSWVPPVW